MCNADTENKLMVTKGEEGRDKLRVSDQQIQTIIYKTDKQQGPQLYFNFKKTCNEERVLRKI